MISSDQLSASRLTRLSLPQYIELDGTVLQLHGELVDLDVQRHRNIEDATGSGEIMNLGGWPKCLKTPVESRGLR
jgi:hypothetical protein